MSKTPIQWTDESVNPIRFRNKQTGKVGHFCEKVSPGCKNCYSDKMQTGPYLSGLAFIAENKDKGDLFFEPKVLERVVRRKKPTKYFWCDMTDLFGSWVPDEWIDRCFATMALTPQHTHQVLTKRADRMREYFKETPLPEFGPEAVAFDGAHARVFSRMVEMMLPTVDGRRLNRTCELLDELYPGEEGFMRRWPLPNVWLGVSVEDQQRKDRIDILRETPAAVRFLSLEPLLEDLGALDLRGIDWCIAGGESGPGARPCDVAWIRSIVQQCKAADVPVFVKQLGAKPTGPERSVPEWVEQLDSKGGNWEVWPADLRVREYPARLEAPHA
jgi:protein gp37